jgi:hypothetical protein
MIIKSRIKELKNQAEQRRKEEEKKRKEKLEEDGKKQFRSLEII